MLMRKKEPERAKLDLLKICWMFMLKKKKKSSAKKRAKYDSKLQEIVSQGKRQRASERDY